MAELSFFNSLDEEQLRSAEAVANAAIKAGVNPRFAVSIAFKEGALRPGAPRGASGEVGMMQVMPKTGKGLGYDEKALADPSKNIEAGVKYLREGLDASGNDSKLASIYYNGGPAALNAMKSGQEPDPRVFDYLRALNSYGTFNIPVSVSEPTPEERAEAGASKPAETDEERDVRVAADEEQVRAEQAKRMAQTYGGAVGTGIAGSRLAGGAALGAASAIGEASEKGRMAARARAPSPVAPVAPGPAGAAPAPATAAPAAPTAAPPPRGPIQLGAPGTFPAATGPGSATYNYARAFGVPEIEAGKALGIGKDSGEVWDLLKQRQQGITNIGTRFPGETWTENPRYGGLMTPGQGAGGGPRATYVAESPAAPGATQGGLRALPPAAPISTQPIPPPQPSGLQRVTGQLQQLAKPIISGAATVGRYAVPPLALAGAAGELQDAATEYGKEAPDKVKMVLSGLSGAAGLAALYPPLTIPAGIVGGGAALINYLRDQEKLRGTRPPEHFGDTSYNAP